jgi:hypothetical protein
MAWRRHRFTIVCGVLLAVLAILGTWSLSWDSEERLVYAAVIQAAYDGPDVSHFMILDTTEPWTRWGVYPFHAKKLGLPSDVRTSYAAKNFAHFHIRPDLQLPHS